MIICYITFTVHDPIILHLDFGIDKADKDIHIKVLLIV